MNSTLALTLTVKAYCCTGILYSPACAAADGKTDAEYNYKSSVAFCLRDNS